jgi:hypothetical protein
VCRRGETLTAFRLFPKRILKKRPSQKKEKLAKRRRKPAEEMKMTR